MQVRIIKTETDEPVVSHAEIVIPGGHIRVNTDGTIAVCLRDKRQFVSADVFRKVLEVREQIGDVDEGLLTPDELSAAGMVPVSILDLPDRTKDLFPPGFMLQATITAEEIDDLPYPGIGPATAAAVREALDKHLESGASFPWPYTMQVDPA